MINGTSNPKACINNYSYDMVIESGYIFGMDMCFFDEFQAVKGVRGA